MSASCCMFFLGLLPMWEENEWTTSLSSFSLGCTANYSWFLFSFVEQRRLKKTDVPLLHRLIQGPSKENARIFLMDKDATEISSDVWILSPWICLSFLLTQHLSQNLHYFLFCFALFPFQVAQYINFHFPLLESILQRLNEEEKREIQRTITK